MPDGKKKFFLLLENIATSVSVVFISFWLSNAFEAFSLIWLIKAVILQPIFVKFTLIWMIKPFWRDLWYLVSNNLSQNVIHCYRSCNSFWAWQFSLEHKNDWSLFVLCFFGVLFIKKYFFIEGHLRWKYIIQNPFIEYILNFFTV